MSEGDDCAQQAASPHPVSNSAQCGASLLSAEDAEHFDKLGWLSSTAVPCRVSSSFEADEQTSSGKDNLDLPTITMELLLQGNFFDMPMSKAASILGRSEGSFQRLCRNLGILRWPYRVRKSLQAIMAKTEQYLEDEPAEDGMSKAEVLKVLKLHMDDIKGIAGHGMDKATKQYRQYIFKLNHKLSRKAANLGCAGVRMKGMVKAASKISKSRHAALVAGLEDSGKVAGTSQQHGRQLPCSINAPLPAESGLQAAAGRAGSQACLRPEPRRPGRLMLPQGACAPLGGVNTLENSLAAPVSAPSGHAFGVYAGRAPSAEPTSASPQQGTPMVMGAQGPAGAEGLAAYRAACMRDDEELLRLCVEIDGYLAAARNALAGKALALPPVLPLGGWGRTPQGAIMPFMPPWPAALELAGGQPWALLNLQPPPLGLGIYNNPFQ